LDSSDTVMAFPSSSKAQHILPSVDTWETEQHIKAVDTMESRLAFKPFVVLRIASKSRG
jgi:hypothetical protein